MYNRSIEEITGPEKKKKKLQEQTKTERRTI